MNDVLLEIKNLSKRYCKNPKRAAGYAMRDIGNDLRRLENRDYLRPDEFWAVRDVSFEVGAGEVVGLIGHNGAGKSTLINLAAGILRPTLGSITLTTRRVVLMDHQGGLSPVQTGRENIGNQLSVYGMQEAEISALVEEVAAYSELGDFIDAPVGTYSLGMKVRLAFAIYSKLKPDLFIVDEALSGGDIRFKAKFYRFLRGYIADGGAILVASHDLFSVQALCHRCVLMEKGLALAVGAPQEVIYTYNRLALEKDKDFVIEPAALEAEARFANALLNPEQETDPVADDIKAEPVPVLEERTPDPNPPLEESYWETVPVAEDNKTEADRLSKDKDLGTEVHDIVKFHKIELTGGDGGLIYPGGPVMARIVCDSSEAVEPVLCSLEIGAGAIFPLTTLCGGYGEPAYRLQPGRNEFVCCIKQFPLAPGLYYARIYVVERDSGSVIGMTGGKGDNVNFEVHYPLDPAMNIIVFRNNLVYVDAAWAQHPRAGREQEE